MPFLIETLYNGKPITEISEEHINSVLKLDPFFERRREKRDIMLRNIIHPFALFFHKYRILTKVLNNETQPVNVSLLNLVQDAYRQNISDLSEIFRRTIDFINSCQGISPLMQKGCQTKYIQAVAESMPSPKKELILARNIEIESKRVKLFSFNSKGIPIDESFESLKEKVCNIRTEIKAYRDTVASHDGQFLYDLSFEAFDNTINEFKNFLSELYTVLTFERDFGEAVGSQMNVEETQKILIKEIYG